MPEPYRAPNTEELRSMGSNTPRRLDRVVRVDCPTGEVIKAKIAFEDGEDLRNVLRALISMEPQGDCLIYLTRFNNEIGKVVFEVANCVLGSSRVDKVAEEEDHA